MAKRRNQPPTPEEQACSGAGNGGVVPPPEHRFKPGQSGNPAGRKTAGATIREWFNSLSDRDLTEAEIRAIARNKRLPWTKRVAADRILRSLEVPDLADFDPVIKGEMSLSELRETGIATEIVKKLKRRVHTTKDGDTEEEAEVELHDRSGAEVDRLMDRTEGRPKQEVTTHVDGSIRTLSDGEAAADQVLAQLRERFGGDRPGDAG